MAREKIINLACKISRVKRGSKDEIKPEYPEYKILEPIVTDEMADVAMFLKFRQPQSAEEIAAQCGKSVEETSRLLWELAVAGVAIVNKKDGVDKYWHDVWVPGHMEMIVNNKENVRKYPQVGEAFDAYGKRRGPKTAGNFPVGTGVMRVIPIQKALDAGTRHASYEEVSKYLNEATIFSVSDCSCRTSREVMGEGCGHLKEDMCIQLGHAAEYYIRTGRGRQITREEAFEIIRRAEENGLMHSIPNLDGPGHTHAICNCCGCGCFSMRIANMYRNPDMVRSNFVAQVDPEKCVACGACVENCPSNAAKLGQKICADKLGKPEKKVLPYDTEWGPDKWNPDYRINRKVVEDTGSSPCKAGCPAHIGIQGYMKLAAQGKYTEALELIKQENPFPAVCGRICPRKCESECTRGNLDDPLAIDEIKKFIAEKDLHAGSRYIPRKRHEYGNKIAVIGAGPAGLSCAYFLALDGYNVTVFEKEKLPGGMLTFGIPAFRLEKDVIDAEIDVLRALGVTIKTGIEVGKDVTIPQLRKEGYEAFYIAVGAQAGRMLNLPGEDAAGVMTGLDFLRKVNLGDRPQLSGKVAVIGGGNVAIDVARTAVRTGAQKVTMYCLEKREEMPALPEEIEEALHEGISIENSWGPKQILTRNGKVSGVEFKRCTAVFNAEGKFSPTYNENETITIDADYVLLSVGQAIDWGKLLEGTTIELNPNKTIKVDPITFQTSEPDVFAGGDVVTGPKFAIDAIAVGKEGAISLHRFVHKGQSLVLGRLKRDYKPLDKENLDLEGYDRIPRQRPLDKETHGAPAMRDTRGTFTEDQVKKETERCLSCGASVIDEFMCVGCGQCVTQCKFDAIKLVRRYDEPGVPFEKLKPTVVKYMLMRKLRIAGKKLVTSISKPFSGSRQKEKTM
ncbi:MAG TPA: FAD-dependent oxidoreductase [Spirochaetales bacterium]|nr:FAD-dependent oxidoreductase [Spirochaetales bacterium]